MFVIALFSVNNVDFLDHFTEESAGYVSGDLQSSI